jgi:S1-C subfamily serine protease
MARTRLSRPNTYLAFAWFVLVSCVMQPAALAQATKDHERMDELNQFSRSIQALAARVSPSVVQVLVTRYGPGKESAGSTAVVTRQENLGSGVIIDPAGTSDERARCGRRAANQGAAGV